MKIFFSFRIHRRFFLFLALSSLFLPHLSHAVDPYVEPGSLRLTQNLMLEGVLHRVQPGWGVQQDPNFAANKLFSQNGSSENPWKTEWGQKLLTDMSARFTPDIAGRMLFEVQGDYADRYWRPLNYEHHEDLNGSHVFLRQGEAQIDKEHWNARWFDGVGHGDWHDKGDFFHLYRESYGDTSYLGSSSMFGIYPESWNQDYYTNISYRHVPQGFEGGLNFAGFDAGAAYGRELVWGIYNSYYGRLGIPYGKSKFNFVYKNEEVPVPYYSSDERIQATSMSWDLPFEEGNRIQAGLLYQPFRVGKPYTIAHETNGGAGLLGSSWDISQKTAKSSQAWAERVRFDGVTLIGNRYWNGAIDLTHADILAGDKNEAGLELGTDILPEFKWKTSFTYRKPVEGPVPFLFEGTPDNIGAVASTPRGPESPFTVNWENREAKILLTTLWFDPTPGTNSFKFDPATLSAWNISPDEDAPYTVAFQHRMSDYPTATDRQYYYNSLGNIQWEPTTEAGAWPTKHPIHDFRILGFGHLPHGTWTLGLAGGEMLAQGGIAYTASTTHTKPITDYYSIEGGLKFIRWEFWGHYGTGVWGPEPNIHPFFGESYDRLYGLGTRYYFTSQTTWDISYLAARQDSLFLAPGLGSFDEIRTVFSHRFGFLFNFQKPLRAGTSVP